MTFEEWLIMQPYTEGTDLAKAAWDYREKEIEAYKKALTDLSDHVPGRVMAQVLNECGIAAYIG